MTEEKRNIVWQQLQKYDIQFEGDIKDALKDLLGAQMDEHIDYQNSQRSDSKDCRNGYKSMRIDSSYEAKDIQVFLSSGIRSYQKINDASLELETIYGAEYNV